MKAIPRRWVLFVCFSVLLLILCLLSICFLFSCSRVSEYQISESSQEKPFKETGSKSLQRSDSYLAELSQGSNKIFHLSFDDTIMCLKDISENDYESIFDNPTFSWLRELHQTYGVVISCYCFFEEPGGGLI